MKKLLILLLSGILVLTACSDAKPKTLHAKRGFIEAKFTENAQTTLDKTYQMDMPFAGKLLRINLLPGDKVKKDQVVASMDLLPLKLNLQQLKAQAEASKQQAKSERAVLNDAKSKLTLAQETYDRENTLANQKYLSKQDIDKIKTDLVTAKNAVKQQKALLASSLANQASLEASAKNAEYQLNNASIQSPINGDILKRFTQGGEWLASGTPLLKIGNLKQLQAVSDVLSTQVEDLKIGNIVNLRAGMNNNLTWQGKVIRIDPAGFTKQSALGVDEQRVPVTISIQQKPNQPIGVGFRLYATFIVGTNKQALIVPRYSVLQDNNGHYFVVKDVNGKFVKQIIKLGLQNDNQIEVVSGLTEKDVIVAEPNTGMV